MPNPFTATRYHSLIIRQGTLPPEYEISSWTDHDEIMGVRHKTWPLEGVQYHPESFLTEQGERLLANFPEKVNGRDDPAANFRAGCWAPPVGPTARSGDGVSPGVGGQSKSRRIIASARGAGATGRPDGRGHGTDSQGDFADP